MAKNTKKNPLFIIALVLVASALVFIANLTVQAYLAPIPEVGPGVCAWRNPMPNGPRCDESHQKCAPGCPEISTPTSPSQGGSGESPSSISSPSYSPPSEESESGNPCQNTRILSCANTCAGVRSDKKQLCLSACVTRDTKARKALIQCASKVAKVQRKRAEVRASREAHQQARDEARRSGRVTSVNAGPTTPEAEKDTQPPEEPFDFTIMVSPSPQKTPAGATAKYRVQVLPKGKGKPKPILLSFGGAGIFDLVKNKRAYWSFGGGTTTEGTPPFSTTLTITTTRGSIPGDYPLTVRATGPTTHTAEFDLEILATDKQATRVPVEKPTDLHDALAEKPTTIPQRQVKKPKEIQPIEWSEIKEKFKKIPGREYVKGEDFAPPLTQGEFLTYLRELEDKNPDMSWKTLVAYLHGRAYEAKGDLKNTLGRRLEYEEKKHPTITGVARGIEMITPVPVVLVAEGLASNTPLFIHVPETNKWKKVDDKNLGELYGRKIIDNGETIDMAHSYAGLRSDIGRIAGSTDQKKMLIVNTDAGDYSQELSPPNEQLKGNAIGHILSGYYQDPKHANKKLSEAYADILASKAYADILASKQKMLPAIERSIHIITK